MDFKFLRTMSSLGANPGVLRIFTDTNGAMLLSYSINVIYGQPGLNYFDLDFSEANNVLGSDDYSVDEHDNYVIFSRGTASHKIVKTVANIDPISDKYQQNVHVLSQNLFNAAKRLFIFASKDTTRPQISGVFLGNGIIAATDGFRLAQLETEQDFGEQIIHPVIGKLPDSSDDVKFYIGERTVKFSYGGYEFILPVINGVYPDVSRILNIQPKHNFVISRDELYTAISEVAPMADGLYSFVTFELSKDSIGVRATSEHGSESKYIIRGNYADGIIVVLNYKFVLDFLKKASGDIKVFLSSGTEPVVFSGLFNNVYARYVVMPINKI